MKKIFSEQVVLGGITSSLEIASALLEIEDGKIIRCTKCSRSEMNFEGVSDLGDSLVSPTFVNSHTHLCMLAFRGIGGQKALSHNIVKDLYFHLEENITPNDVLCFTRLGGLEALLSGVGTVWEHYYYGDSLVQALDDVGLCAAIGSTLQDISGPGKDRTQQALDETIRLAEDTALTKKGLVAVLAPHATDTVSDSLWTTVADLATQHQLPIHSHLSQALDEVEWSWKHHGCSPLERMHRLGLTTLDVPRLWVHGLFISKEELQSLDPLLDTLGHCPSAQMQFGFPAYTNAWRAKGLKIVLGTDAASCNDGINVQSEIKFFAAADSYAITMGDTLQKFRNDGSLSKARRVQAERQIIFDMRSPYSTPERLLSSVWGHAGDLHPQLPVGAIEEGRLANILVWDSNHPSLWPNWAPLQGLAMSNATPAIQRIMLRGEWLFDGDGYLANRIMQDPKIREWQKEANFAWKALMKRTKLPF